MQRQTINNFKICGYINIQCVYHGAGNLKMNFYFMKNFYTFKHIIALYVICYKSLKQMVLFSILFHYFGLLFFATRRVVCTNIDTYTSQQAMHYISIFFIKFITTYTSETATTVAVNRGRNRKIHLLKSYK